MDDIEIMAAKAAVKKMMRDGYVSICTIDKILEMSGGIPDSKDYNILRALHCVHFSDMEPELRRGLPVLISRVLESKPIHLDIEFNTKHKPLLLEA